MQSRRVPRATPSALDRLCARATRRPDRYEERPLPPTTTIVLNPYLASLIDCACAFIMDGSSAVPGAAQLPTEILEHISSFIAPDARRPTFAAFCLVNRRFHTLFTPNLYRSITLAAGPILLRRRELAVHVFSADFVRADGDRRHAGSPWDGASLISNNSIFTELDLSNRIVVGLQQNSRIAIVICLLHILPALRELTVEVELSTWDIFWSDFGVQEERRLPDGLRALVSLTLAFNGEPTLELSAAIVVRLMALPELQSLTLRGFIGTRPWSESVQSGLPQACGTSVITTLDLDGSHIRMDHLAQLLRIPRALRRFRYLFEGLWLELPALYDALRPQQAALNSLEIDAPLGFEDCVLGPLGSLRDFASLASFRTNAEWLLDGVIEPQLDTLLPIGLRTLDLSLRHWGADWLLADDGAQLLAVVRSRALTRLSLRALFHSPGYGAILSFRVRTALQSACEAAHVMLALREQ
jgi:hypothetical protein